VAARALGSPASGDASYSAAPDNAGAGDTGAAAPSSGNPFADNPASGNQPAGSPVTNTPDAGQPLAGNPVPGVPLAAYPALAASPQSSAGIFSAADPAAQAATRLLALLDRTAGADRYEFALFPDPENDPAEEAEADAAASGHAAR
jgi:hypothetical protein